MEMPKQKLFLAGDAGAEVGDSQLQPLCWKWAITGAEDTHGILAQLGSSNKNSFGVQGSALGSQCLRAKKEPGN